MGVTENNPGSLAELTRKVRYLQGAGFKAELSQVLAAEALHQVEEGFIGERDPYGRPWAPLSRKRRRGSRASAQLLRDSGRMYNSRAAAPTDGGFRLSITARYAAVHQYGGVIPARSNARAQTIWQNPRTGRIVGRNTRLKSVLETTPKHGSTFGQIVIPRRQMVPEKDTGGLGPIWLPAFNQVADSLMRRRMGAAA